MVTLHLIPAEIAASYEVHEWRNAAGVLHTAHPAEWQDIADALRAFRFRRGELLQGGGAKSVIASRIDGFLDTRGWRETKFATSIRVDATERESPTHKVDCFKGRVGLEIEWNNKDPFFDRDLNNFRLLFDLRVIDVGVIVTRASDLQSVFRGLWQQGREQIRCVHHACGQAAAPAGGRRRGRLPDPGVRHHPRRLYRRRTADRGGWTR